MPSKSITERLGDGEFLLMDGATGSEIQARGADLPMMNQILRG